MKDFNRAIAAFKTEDIKFSRLRILLFNRAGGLYFLPFVPARLA